MITFLAPSLISPKKRAFFLAKTEKDSFIYLFKYDILNCVRYVSLISFNLFKGVAEKWN